MISTFFVASLAAFDKESRIKSKVEPQLKQYARAVGLNFPPKQLMFRVFKDEKTMEVWGANSPKSTLKLIKRYPILAASGTLGPKRKYGDLQVPEGWYSINRFNPNSSYHLSLGINYPTDVERDLARPNDPGGDIYIHGNHKSAGCLAMGDPAIEEIYTLAKMASNVVYVFLLPSRINPGINIDGSANFLYYSQLYKLNSHFEATHRLPVVKIDHHGVYHIH